MPRRRFPADRADRITSVDDVFSRSGASSRFTRPPIDR